MRTFEEAYEEAMGLPPYRYQAGVAEEGLPEVLSAPTGAGKTAAVVLPWLWRRRFHPDEAVRAATPHWLVIALPLRTLAEQTFESVRAWVAALGLLDDLGVHLLLGGEGRAASAWREHPDQDAVFIGSIDMLLSRALNRGYALNRFVWPVDFGVFNNGCHWVLDEVQLMGPALPSSRQLQGLRDKLGTALPTSTTWMSATLRRDALRTADAPEIGAVVEVTPEGSEGELAARIGATRRIEELTLGRDDHDAALAEAANAAHRPGTRTLVMVNTVSRAQAVYRRLIAVQPDAQVVLVHSRFRPPERAAATRRATQRPDEAGTIVVSTQALEAGIDISSATLVTEAAIWPSVVQRAGRCNRYGEHDDARLLWTTPPSAAPYEDEDVEAAVAALREHEGAALTGATLASIDPLRSQPVYAVLRRKDLVELFDTAPDLSGNDVDVGRFIRDAEDIDVRIAWRSLSSPQSASGQLEGVDAPGRDELCPAPIGDLRRLLARGEHPLWRYDHLAEGWVRCRGNDLRPGMVLLADERFGRYSPELGWEARQRGPVEPLAIVREDPLAAVDEGMGEDRLSTLGRWVPLHEHLADADEAAGALLDRLAPGLPEPLAEAVRLAARYHDIGKAHDVFQDALRAVAPDAERAEVDAGGPWAKSSSKGRLTYERRGFRHGLAGALALLSPEGVRLLDGVAEAELIAYLVAAHHGRVRLGIRSQPKEAPCASNGGRPATLGVCDGDMLPAVRLPDGDLPATRLSLEPVRLGGEASWTAMALKLRDRKDLGPFRLGFLEAVVRLADWRASAEEAR